MFTVLLICLYCCPIHGGPFLGGWDFSKKTCRPGTAVRQAGEGGQMGIIDMHGGSHVTAVYTKFQP